MAPMPRAATPPGLIAIVLIGPHAIDRAILERRRCAVDWDMTHVRTCDVKRSGCNGLRAVGRANLAHLRTGVFKIKPELANTNTGCGNLVQDDITACLVKA